MGILEEHAAVRNDAGAWLVESVGVLQAVGADRESWTNGMVTNDVRAIPVGGSAPAAVVSVKGRILATLDVWREPERIRMLIEDDRLEAVHPILERYLVMEDVTLTDERAAWAVVTVQGPRAEAVVAGLDLLRRPRDRSGVGGFDLLVPRTAVQDVLAALARAGAAPVGDETAEWLRVEGGVRRWGREVGEDVFPQEARIEASHVSFSKGCYVGQETVVRLRDRGHANRLLVGLDLGQDAAAPPPGAPVLAGGVAVGAVTSAVRSPALGRTVAMSFVKRAHANPGTALAVDAPAGPLAARVVALPPPVWIFGEEGLS